MAQLFVNIIGHNSSGKTTLAQKLAKEFGFNRVNGDNFRKFVYENIAYFKNTDLSFPNERYRQLNPLVVHYRIELTKILLRADQNVIFEGSGNTPEHRARYLKEIRTNFPEVKRVIIWVDIDEEKLLKRLKERDEGTGTQWTRMYQEIKKQTFVPPHDHETDAVLRYDQTNYPTIRKKIERYLGQ